MTAQAVRHYCREELVGPDIEAGSVEREPCPFKRPRFLHRPHICLKPRNHGSRLLDRNRYIEFDFLEQSLITDLGTLECQ